MRCLGLAACWFRLLSAVLYSVLKTHVGPYLSAKQALSQTCVECLDFAEIAQSYIDGMQCPAGSEHQAHMTNAVSERAQSTIMEILQRNQVDPGCDSFTYSSVDQPFRLVAFGDASQAFERIDQNLSCRS